MKRRPTRGLVACARGAVAAVAAVVWAAGVVAGQEVRGVVEESETGRPLGGAFVSLVGEASGEAVAATLTDPAGAYVLHAFEAGHYRLRVERIGYETWETEGLEAGPGRTVRRRLAVRVRPVGLPDLRVDLGRQCRPRPGAETGKALAVVWEEARKALEVNRWTEERRRVRLVLRRWERVVEPGTERVRGDESRTWETEGPRSFSSAPAEELASEGWVREEEEGVYGYYAPDAGVLLSDVFLSGHCFWLVRGAGTEAGLVGLAFEPLARPERPDVEGALWLRAATSELERLEFRYVGLELPVSRHEGGGRVELRRLPGGEWIVSRWWIRMPVATEAYVGRLRQEPGRVRIRREPRATVAHYRETGGEVVRVAYGGRPFRDLAEWGAVEGVVTDGLAGGEPLAGVEVFLEGTAYRTRADGAGRFRLEAVPPGEYTLAVRDPELALLGAEPVGQAVSVRKKRVTRRDVALAEPELRLAAICPEPEGERRAPSALVGFVRDSETGEPVPGAAVWVARSEYRARAHLNVQIGEDWERQGVFADDAGIYRVCGLRGDWHVVVQAVVESGASDTTWVRTPRGGVRRLDLEFSASKRSLIRFGLEGRRVAEDAARDAVAPEGERRSNEAGGALLHGVVRSAETGDPVSGATVRLPGTGLGQVTGADGAFVIAGVPRGRHRVVTEHLGMGSDTAEVTVYGAEEAVVGVFTLQTRPVELPELQVTVEREFRNPRLAGYYDRLERGLGHYMTRDDLERRDVISNFRRIPNVRVAQCVEPGTGLRKANCWELELARGFDRCKPVVYLDGHSLTSPSGADPLGMSPFNVIRSYPGHSLEGIEVYRNPAMAPGQYRGPGDACGIILVWTRDSRR